MTDTIDEIRKALEDVTQAFLSGQSYALEWKSWQSACNPVAIRALLDRLDSAERERDASQAAVTEQAMRRALELLNKTQEALGRNLENHRNPSDTDTVRELMGLHDCADALAVRRGLSEALAAYAKKAGA